MLGDRTDVLSSAGEVLGGAAPGQGNAQDLSLSASRQRDAAGEAREPSSGGNRRRPQLLGGRPHRVSDVFRGLERCVLCVRDWAFCSKSPMFDRFRAGDPALLWVPRRLCERLELARALVVRLLVDELPRGFELPRPDFRVLLLLVCWATRSSFTAVGYGLPGTEADYRNLRILGGNVRKPPPWRGSARQELTSDIGIKVSLLRKTQENRERRCVSSAETPPSS